MGDLPMADELFTITDEVGARVIALRLPATLDVMTFDTLNVTLLAEVQKAPANYIIDLGDTNYVGSAVLGLLVNIRSRVRKGGKKLALCRLSPRIVEIFRIGSLESLFTIRPDVPGALDALK